MPGRGGGYRSDVVKMSEGYVVFRFIDTIVLDAIGKDWIVAGFIRFRV